MAIVAFLGGTYWYANKDRRAGLAQQPASGAAALIRAHSPVLGPADAPVTVVEFFDPACETCRAFYPLTKELIADWPGKVRLVLRYAALHQGSNEVVLMLEAARAQGVYIPVLEAVLDAQPQWASHGAPEISRAWAAAERAGLDVDRARRDMQTPEIIDIARQDARDVEALGVRKTPTFFVNGKPLQRFGMQELYDLVQKEVQSLAN
ncbi:MAG: thioredoxin domain-containing protein [Alphaproteobacteria bacterium]